MDKNEMVVQQDVSIKETVRSFEKCIVLGKELTMYGSLEEPLFLAKDVAEWIEHSNPTAMLSSIDEDEKLCSRTKDSLGRDNAATFLTEDGLYEVLMQSRKPIAKSFKKEVKRILKELRLKGEAKMEHATPQKTDLEIRNETRQLVNEAKRLKLEEAAYWTRLAEKYSHNKDYSQILDAYSTKALEGKFILPLPEIHKPFYSAGEVGNILGISANKVGRIAKEFDLKTERYGKWFMDKSPYSAKQVESFRYNDCAVEFIRSKLSE